MNVLVASLLAAPVIARADRGLLERVMTDAGVVREPATSSRPYAVDLASALADALRRLLRPAGALLSGAGDTLTVVAWVLLAVLAAALAVLVARAIAGRARRPRRERPRSAAPVVAETPRGRASWRVEVEERLAAGDVAGALRALWWYLALSLAARVLDASWTTGELLDRCGRRDLSSVGRALDRMMYGPARPAVDEVRRLCGTIEGMLP